MTTIVTRSGKGSPLTHTEVDTNFTNLNTAKFETAAIPLGTAAAPSVSFLSDANTGIYSPGADQLAVATNGTGRLFVDATGNVGVGITPSELLHVNGSAIVKDRLSLQRLQSSDNLSVLTFSDTLTGSKGNNLSFGNPGGFDLLFHIGGSEKMRLTSTGLAIEGRLSLQRLQSSDNLSVLTFSDTLTGSKSNNLSFGNSGGFDLLFHTGGVEKARIDSSGRLLVGTIASPAHQLQVSTDSAGKPSTNTWTIVSDERIKEEIELADLDLCYQAVKNIPLKRFKWKDEVYTEEQVRDRRKLGWIAQDVEAVFPKAVGTYEFKYNQVFEETIIPAVEEVLDDEGNVTTPAQPERIEKGELISEDVIEDCRDLNSDQLYAAMYGAIQKLMLKVETLDAEVALLKAQ